MENTQLSLFETKKPIIEKSVTKTFFEKRFGVSRATLVKMLDQVPGYVKTKSWYIHPKEAMLIINHYG